jgi:hypothetical protein
MVGAPKAYTSHHGYESKTTGLMMNYEYIVVLMQQRANTTIDGILRCGCELGLDLLGLQRAQQLGRRRGIHIGRCACIAETVDGRDI